MKSSPSSLVTRHSSRIGVVILGAGASSRMGRPKLLLPWKNTTVIGHIIRQWRELGAAQIAVVHRPNDEALVEAIKHAEGGAGSPLPATTQMNDGAHGVTRPANSSTHCIVNPRAEQGMFSSIVCAANWPGWRREISNWAIVLGDQPHLQTATLRALLKFAAQNPDAIYQPQFGDHGRHPVILPRTGIESLKRTQAGNLRDFLKQIRCPSVKCPMADPGLALDMDTPEDYRQLKVAN
jgi:molybdenum cofactor cytidylyltransferase